MVTTKSNHVPSLDIHMANDLGYGGMKAWINGQNYIIPSTMAILGPKDVFQPKEYENDKDTNEYLGDFLNHLDVAIQSDQVKENRRAFIGNAAIRSRLQNDVFNVSNYEGKSDTDLALILTLSVIGGEAIREEYAKLSNEDKQIAADHETVPFTDINVAVTMTTALPVSEGKTPGKIDKYIQRYLNNNNEHLAVFNNFQQKITVHIKFKQVIVALEGETAQIEIMNANPQLASLIKNDFDKSYPEYKDEITAEDLTTQPNFIGIDIGEGTTDIVVFNNHKINEHASVSLKQGFGNALENALAELQQNGVNVTSRADLEQDLKQKITPFNRGLLQEKHEAVGHQLEAFQKAIVNAFSRTLANAGSDIYLIYVYGGGASPMDKMSNLRQSLIEETKHQTGGHGIFTVFIDKSYAQLLNEAGLHLLLDRMLEADTENAD